jgi:hypothetical protein
MTHPLHILADRVEGLSGPDRGLDALIAIAIDPTRYIIVGTKPGPFPQDPIYGPVTDLIDMAEANGGDVAGYLSAPAYTASLDAAMSLVPEGLGIGWRMTDGAGGPAAEIWDIDLDSVTERYHVAANPTATPALALTAASLRAIAANQENGVG